MQHEGKSISRTKPPRHESNFTINMSKEQNGDTTGSRPEADFAEVQMNSPLVLDHASDRHGRL
jgi:hypothetical protein